MSEKQKLNIAIYWGGACGGCDVAVLDIDEKILDLAAAADIRFWPIALDFKISDLVAMENGFLDLVFFNGSVRNSEQLHLARLLRSKAKTLIAFGACAHMGGIPGLANFSDKQAILETVYRTSASMEPDSRVYPEPVCAVKEGEIDIPVMHEFVKSLDQQVTVDYYIPGCPPTTNIINMAIDAVVTGNLPPHGSIIAGKKNLCDECPRERSDNKSVKRFYRVHEIIPESVKCLLEQGILCNGPATRGGCGARCITANMPCRGCFGPADGVLDMGAKMLSAASSVIDSNDPEEISRICATLPDIAGTFYRFNLPVSLLKRRK